MTTILAQPQPPLTAPHPHAVRLSLYWPIAPEGLSHAARFAGAASLDAARVVCTVESDHLTLSLECWSQSRAPRVHGPPPTLVIPLIRCGEPDLRVVVDDAERVCHVDAAGVASITCSFCWVEGATAPRPDVLLYARTTVAQRLGLPPATLERAVCL